MLAFTRKVGSNKRLSNCAGFSIFTLSHTGTEQEIEILLKSQYGQVQYPNDRSCNVLTEVKCVTTDHYK